MTERTKVDELREALQKQKETAAPDASAPAASAPEDSTDGELAALRAQLVDAEARAAAHHDKLLRMMAEFDNYRKRMERDHAAAVTFANEQLLKDFMVILDHLDEALSHIPTGEECPPIMRSFAEGVELTFRQCLLVLKRYGFEEVPTVPGTPFDPSIHEAITQVDVEGSASNTIVHRQRRGYALHGRLLRAALVTVAK